MPAPTGGPEFLDEIIMKMVETDPEKRYQAFGEVLADLEESYIKRGYEYEGDICDCQERKII